MKKKNNNKFNNKHTLKDGWTVENGSALGKET